MNADLRRCLSTGAPNVSRNSGTGNVLTSVAASRDFSMHTRERGLRHYAYTLLACVCIGLFADVPRSAAIVQPETDLDADEELILYPAIAHLRGSSWVAHIEAWIFEHRSGWDRIAAMKKFLKERFHLTDAEMDLSSVFPTRARMFFVDNERNQRIAVSVRGGTHRLERSDEAGRIAHQLALGPAGPTESSFGIEALTKPRDARVIRGTVRVVDGDGFSVVSDIDDTIKHSNVLNRRELAANTFLRAFTAVPGMAALYRRWEAAGDVVFHYVSGSPRQLYPALADFVSAEKFPAGTFTLRHFRWSDRSAAEFLENRTLQYKTQAIEALIKMFPQRHFVLVGDSGEMDPEVYTGVAMRAPGQVRAILIRDVRGEDINSPRFVRLFGDLPPAVVRRVFREVNEIAHVAFQ